jgi:hypothetical protein
MKLDMKIPLFYKWSQTESVMQFFSLKNNSSYINIEFQFCYRVGEILLNKISSREIPSSIKVFMMDRPLK